MTKLSLFRTGALVAASLGALTVPAYADRGPDPYRGGYSGVVLHADAGFRGEAIEVAGAIPDLKPMRFNDRVSSISVRSGAWEVCTDANFRGRCATVDTSVSRLNDLRLNDNVSSLRPVGYGPGSEGQDGAWNYGHGGRSANLVPFSNVDLRGEPIEINGDIADLTAYRFNDRASSVLVTRGTGIACEHANYRGRYEVISRGSGDLRPTGLNDNISSICRYDGRDAARNGNDRDWRRH
ncbi:beta/gamma crystallin-related protein [Hyphomonas sp.]|uniref:beta/gamma crystallin-related protein n=1 Tax=Hyphomonas sp. TaxID=87 RepID=UPI00356A08C4